MERMDKRIKDYLKAKRPLLAGEDVLRSADEYYRYLAGEMAAEDEAAMQKHLAGSRTAQELVLGAKRLMEDGDFSGESAVPERLIRSAKGLRSNRPSGKQFLWTILWLGLTIVCLALSFAVHRYYMQFIALGLLFGFKCIMDHKVYKTQILVYKALESDPEAQEKLRDKNRIF